MCDEGNVTTGPQPDQSKMDIPGHLPASSQVVREDWAKYLRAIQRTDDHLTEIFYYWRLKHAS